MKEIKTCTVCSRTETPQWYSGSVCKSCYRRKHREENIGAYKKRDADFYEQARDKVLARQKEYYAEHREERAAYAKQHYAEVGWPDRNEYQREYSRNRPGYRAANSARYAKANPEKTAESHRKYWKKNLPKYAARAAHRRARKLLATPIWLSSEQRRAILNIYETCPKGYDVDHIVPLISDLVCGLHVPWNLQHLEASENRKKSNRLIA